MDTNEEQKIPLNEEILSNLEDFLPTDDLDFIKQRFDTQLNCFPEDTKLIACPHEIVFTITANVLAEDKEGQTVDSVELSTRTYHMPVPADKDYSHFMESFMSFFEKAMIDSHQQATQTAQDNTNKEPENE